MSATGAGAQTRVPSDREDAGRARGARGAEASNSSAAAPLVGRRTLRRNMTANFAGRVVPGLLTIAAVPPLVSILGAEAYGVIGVFAVLQVVLATLDVGLTTAATREIARNTAADRPGTVSHLFVASLELVYWVVGAVIALVIGLLAEPIADDWLNPRELSRSEVELALVAAGIALGIRWPVSLYRGVLDGLQLQVRQNAVTVAAAALRVGGGLIVVAAVAPTITAFMVWQIVAAVLELLAMGAAARGALGGLVARPRFDLRVLREVWRYAAALNAVSAVALVLTQVDRVVISKWLPLEDLSHYTIALTATGVVPHVAAAVSAAVFPRFVDQLTRGDELSLLRTYSQATHAVAFIAAAVALPLAFFSEEVLRVWVNSDEVARASSDVLTLLAVAYLINALYVVPFGLGIATGRTRTALIANLVAAPIFAVAMIESVPRWGLDAAAALWLALMGSFFLVYVGWVHAVLLKGRWNLVFEPLARCVLPGVVLFAAARGVAEWSAANSVQYAALVAAVVVQVIITASLLPPEVGIPRPVDFFRRAPLGRRFVGSDPL